MFLLQTEVVWLELVSGREICMQWKKIEVTASRISWCESIRGTKKLTMAKEGSEIIPIGDIGAVAEQGDRDDELWAINNVTVAGVTYFDTYKSCLQCKARVEPHTERLSKCSKMDCMMMQRFDLCPQHITAKLMLLYDKDGQQRTVFAFTYGETVHQIAGGNDVTVEGLMESGAFKSMTLLNDKDIIKEVNK